MAVEELTCTIKRMFNGCPKPDGWFGCFASLRGSYADVMLKGKTVIPLTKGMQLDVKAEKTGENEYEVKEFIINTKTTKGLITYLASIPGVTRQTAIKIVHSLGENALEEIEKDPECLITKVGLTKRQKNSAIEGINRTNDTNMLRKFLPELSANMIKRIAEIPDIKKKVKENPYMLIDIPGITFSIADTIALRFGTNPTEPYRINHGLVHVLQTKSDGNLFVNLSNTDELKRLMFRVEDLLSIHFTNINAFSSYIIALNQIQDSPIFIDYYKGENHLYLREIYIKMLHTVHVLKVLAKTQPLISADRDDILAHIDDYEARTHIRFTNEQRNAIGHTITHRISILTGGPGRGKTKTVDCIADFFRQKHLFVKLMAPTGKAVSKLKGDMTNTYEACTVDSFLTSEEYKRKRTKRHQEIPEKQVFFVDESSMLDLLKMEELLMNIENKPIQICFIGDVDQLPPIADGYVFKDMIDSGIIKINRLTIPFRNQGTILENADKIRENKTDLKYNLNDMPFYPQPEDDNNALNTIIDMYNDEREEYPNQSDVIILSPIRKGVIGTVNLNIVIQEMLCPKTEIPTIDPRTGENIAKGFPIKNSIYGNSNNFTHIRVGDIVINTKNIRTITTFHMENDDYWGGKVIHGSEEKGIVNGDMGRVIAYQPQSIDTNTGEPVEESVMIQWFDNRFCRINITAGEFESFELGYAVTVHKSQGSEYLSVIYVSPNAMTRFSGGFATRNLIYTAITRAKKKVTMIGSKESVNTCITHNLPPVNTNVMERLQA